MKQTTTTDTILREKIDEILKELAQILGRNVMEMVKNPDSIHSLPSMDEVIKEKEAQLLALFESAISKTRVEVIQEVREECEHFDELHKPYYSLKEKQIKV